ncbi:phosphatase PAP2 family protein [Aureispira anguillae]|uniref:Phosphatase PAP2 family protein n=1 Tax=Aureispira anguillae TaxID=2864201 RepID=A0A916DUR1_9BACT|nr:phosphatase PAP2 family protein [Aureispira anguillae]BDS13581.1 phosphatase PAP2 family protein [Aureispira anguillae]
MSDNEEEFSLKKTKYAEYIRDFTAIGNPFLLLLVTLATLSNHPKFHTYFWILLAGFLINEFICSAIKYLWHKPRPNGQQYKNGFEKIDAGSFPSIHSSRISFVYLSLGYIHYMAENFLLMPTFIVVIAVVGYSRIFLKKHFFVDVMAGYFFGTIQFLAITFLLK